MIPSLLKEKTFLLSELLDVKDEIFREKLERRELVSASEEREIRFAPYQAVEKLPVLS